MLKLFGSILVIGATTIIGFLYAIAFTERVRQLRDMQYALNMLESEIIFTSTPIIEALYHVSERSCDSIKKMFLHMCNMLEDKKVQSITEAFDAAFDTVKSEIFFEDEEIEVIKAFMQSLGSSDIEGQKKNFNITVKKLEGFEQNAEEAKKKNEKLYKYLGVCCGFLIVIILL